MLHHNIQHNMVGPCAFEALLTSVARTFERMRTRSNVMDGRLGDPIGFLDRCTSLKAT